MDRTIVTMIVVAIISVGLPHGCHHANVHIRRELCAQVKSATVCDQLVAP